ncbi:MAG TPA: hypothetical protein VFA49_15195 [Chloroflexota bacterium]|nr:hypothetical protein [Chloroflexota bacterium]
MLRAIALTAAGLTTLILLVPAAPLTGDGQHYIAFVRNGLQHGASSWHERRLLGPLIVNALPLDPLDGFHLLTVASLGVTCLLTWLAARHLTTAAHALLAVPLLLGTWVVAPNLREFGLVDPLAWTFVAGVWLATVERRWLLAALVAATGALAKEVVLLAAVAAAAAALDDPRRPARAIGVVMPSLLVVLGLTVLFPGSGTDVGAYLSGWVRDGLGSLGPLRVAYLLFASYGALWLLAPRGFVNLPRHLKRAALVYLATAVLLPLVGSPERMEEAIFPAMVSLALAATRDWRPSLVWTVALASAVFAARAGGDARLPTAVAWAALALACGLALWSYRPWPAMRPARSVA